MSLGKTVATVMVALVATAAVVAAWLTYPSWQGLFGKASTEPPKEHAAGQPESIKLSPQARLNLALKVAPLEVVKEPYWRSLHVPAQVVERPGNCDRLVTAPLAGIVKHIAAVKGDLVQPSEVLVTLQIVGDQLLSTQATLYKTQRELEIVKEEQKRLADPFKSGAIPAAKMIEVENQHQRLMVTLETLRHELAVRGLSPSELLGVANGKFVTEIAIAVPEHVDLPKAVAVAAGQGAALALAQARPAQHRPHGYEVEKLFVKLGEQVQAGQPLCHLADHHLLFIEGYVFGKEAPHAYRAAKQGLPVRAEFPPEDQSDWPPLADLRLQAFANNVDPGNQTLAFHLLLPNQHHDYTAAGKTYRLWRFRPGQRLHLHIPVESFQDVFVVPADAIVREGPEVYVFYQSGSYFVRKPVHVVHENREAAVLANDGSILPGNYIALNAAAQLNWALKASGGEAGHAHHHDH